MSGKGELVKYTRLVQQGPLTDQDKAVLIEKITGIIRAASHAITIEAMVAATQTVRLDEMVEILERLERERREGR